MGAAAALGGDGVTAAAALGETRLCCPVFGARLPKARESWGARLRRSAAARAGVASSKGAVGTPLRAIFRFFFGLPVTASREPGGRGDPGSYGLSYPRALWLARVGVGSADLSQLPKPGTLPSQSDSAGKSHQKLAATVCTSSKQHHLSLIHI